MNTTTEKVLSGKVLKRVKGGYLKRSLWVNAAFPTIDRVPPPNKTNIKITNAGLQLDNQANVDPNIIDSVLNKTLNCLEQLPDPLPAKWSTECYAFPWEPISVRLDTSKLIIRVINEFYLSCRGTGEQLLPYEAPIEGCKSKQLNTEDRNDCTCRWRSLVRATSDNISVAVTPPSLKMLPDAIVRWSTSCHNPWAVPELAACAAPFEK